MRGRHKTGVCEPRRTQAPKKTKGGATVTPSPGVSHKQTFTTKETLAFRMQQHDIGDHHPLRCVNAPGANTTAVITQPHLRHNDMCLTPPSHTLTQTSNDRPVPMGGLREPKSQQHNPAKARAQVAKRTCADLTLPCISDEAPGDKAGMLRRGHARERWHTLPTMGDATR